MSVLQSIINYIIKDWEWYNLLCWLYIVCYRSYSIPEMIRNRKEKKQLLREIEQIGEDVI